MKGVLLGSMMMAAVLRVKSAVPPFQCDFVCIEPDQHDPYVS